MRVFSFFVDGIRRVNCAKRYIGAAYLAGLLLASGLAISMGAILKDHLGSSMAAERMRDGFDALWYSHFSVQAKGLAATFDPGVAGIGAVLNGLDAFLQGKLLNLESGIVAMGLLYLLLWSFFSAAFITIYTRRDEAAGLRPSFFQQGANFFWRFVQLAVLAGVIYYLIFHFVLPWLSNRVGDMTRQMVDERVVFSYVALKYLILWTLVCGVNMVFDYSKIITVQQNRAFVLPVPWQALRMIGRNPVSTAGLYLGTGILGVALLLLYWLIVPGAGRSSWAGVAGAFVLGQLYILSRIWIRCLFYAGQTALYESIAVEPEAPPERVEASSPALETEGEVPDGRMPAVSEGEEGRA